MHYTAQLATTNFCVAVTGTSEPLIGTLFIPLQSYDESVLGRHWNGSSFDPKPVVPRQLSWSAFNGYLLNLLATDVQVAQAKLQDILEKCRDNTATTDAGRQTRYFYTFYLGNTDFSKDEVSNVLANVATTCITPAQKSAVLNNWPMV